jgi:hypothetical protein
MLLWQCLCTQWTNWIWSGRKTAIPLLLDNCSQVLWGHSKVLSDWRRCLWGHIYLWKNMCSYIEIHYLFLFPVFFIAVLKKQRICIPGWFLWADSTGSIVSGSMTIFDPSESSSVEWKVLKLERYIKYHIVTDSYSWAHSVPTVPVIHGSWAHAYSFDHGNTSKRRFLVWRIGLESIFFCASALSNQIVKFGGVYDMS